MDLELLNCWLRRYGMDISNNTLFVNLKECKNDVCHSYALKLSVNTKEILDYLGFDAKINCDALTLKNQYEYLCTSTKLCPNYIVYKGFKDTFKKKEHQHYDKYLRTKYSNLQRKDLTKQERRKFTKDAIEFFGKETDYQLYKQQYKILTKFTEVLQPIHSLEEYSFASKKRFVSYFGVSQIVNMSEEEVKENYLSFVAQNWSGLILYT
jgi:hypothetical protein